MAGTTTRDEFVQQMGRLAVQFAQCAFDELVAKGVSRPDRWMREHGGRVLREVLGAALSARAEHAGMTRGCRCGGALEFRQRRRIRLHTVLPGRDVWLSAGYGFCPCCRTGTLPLLEELECDAEGFTPELRELALLAAVIEPYGQATGELLARFAQVEVSGDKLRALVAQSGKRAERFLSRYEKPPEEQTSSAQHYAMLDGGMVHVDKAWQECKVAVLFSEDRRAQVGERRHELLEKQVIGVRGTPEDLAARLRPRLASQGLLAKPVACIADGAAWIWNLFAQLFPERIEILDWYHLDEHISHAAGVLYGEGTEEAGRWRAVQLDRLEHDEIDAVFEALRFERKATRARAKREAVDDLVRYLENHRHRIRYGTFRAQGLLIGSGAIEGAINHVVQQRMKRPGMRWKEQGADHMLALRCVYRSTGHWDEFLGWKAAA